MADQNDYRDLINMMRRDLDKANEKLIEATDKTNAASTAEKQQTEETRDETNATNDAAADAYSKANAARESYNSLMSKNDKATDLEARLGAYGDILNLDELGLYLDADGDICQK